MKKNVFRYVLILPIVLFACKTTTDQPKTAQAKDTVSIGGSNSELKLVKNFIKEYDDGKLYAFDIDGRGSNEGIEKFINGELSVVNASRKMTEDEIERSRINGLNPLPVILAMDAIAIVSNYNNQVDSISTIDLSRILSGEISNWKEVGGWDHPIRLIGRNELSGTRDVVESNYTSGNGLSPEHEEFLDNEAILKEVMKDSFAISYISAAYLMDKNGFPNNQVWAMNIYAEGEEKSYSPYQYLEVVNGNYPITRPLYQYFDGIPKGKLKEFVDFELSTKGLSIIRSEGFYPINYAYQELNRKNGFEVKLDKMLTKIEDK